MKLSSILPALALTVAFCTAETVKDREGAVRGDKAKMENDPRWIYGDIERGFAEAKKTGRPLLVVLRCVPCLSCMGMDAGVLTDESLSALLDKFVCLRVINANALDMARFQFDYDLSLSALIFNGDGTLYARFGSWRHQRDPQDKTTAGLRASLEAALAIHAGYPANKAALAGKQGAPSPYRTPVEIPALSEKYKMDLDWDGKVVQSCVHCHQIGDALRIAAREKRQPMPPELIFPHPAPETLGLALAADHAARVESVQHGTPAARAGLQPGDDIAALGGQVIASPADVSWVLHGAPPQGQLALVVRRAGKQVAGHLTLPSGWRQKTDISRRVGTWGMRGMALGGLSLVDLTDEERKQRGIGTDTLALFVKGVGQYGKHATAKKAGFQKDDVIVEFDGRKERMSEGEMIGHLLTVRRIGEQVKVKLQRGGAAMELSLPMQ